MHEKRQPNNTSIVELFNKFRNKINREIIKSKKSYFTNYFKGCSNDMKKTWQGIRAIINIKKTIFPKIAQLNVKGRIFDDPKVIAGKVNEFFVNIGPDTELEIPEVPNISPTKFLKQRNQFNFLIAHISNEEVLDIINSLGNKATGPSSITLKLRLLISGLIIIPLWHIMSLSTGNYPDKLKLVKVIPIHKGGSTHDLNNFRPISLISVFHKIIEKIIHSRLYNILELHNILYGNQFGFRKDNSTIYALMQITERIKESIDNGEFGCGIFIDLRKAFDTVNHDILLLKLEHYGVRDNMLNWFKSYLSNRKQYVYLNGVSSDIKEISCGVPQGSVLGPLLFFIIH